MKKLFKSIIAAMLCAVIAITALGTDTAQAASNPAIKVTFNKKTVKFKVTDDGFVKEIKYKTLKKKWGKAKITHENYEGSNYHYTDHEWKKGKTTISYGITNIGSGNCYLINIGDKNGAICGVRSGTKASKAEKAFQNAGANVEKSGNDYMSVRFGEGCYGSCSFKNGKVSSINITLYH